MDTDKPPPFPHQPFTTPTQYLEPAEKFPICYCFDVWESTIERAIRQWNLKEVNEVRQATRACCGCHSCWTDIEMILARCARGDYKFPLEPSAEAKKKET